MFQGLGFCPYRYVSNAPLGVTQHRYLEISTAQQHLEIELLTRTHACLQSIETDQDIAPIIGYRSTSPFSNSSCCYFREKMTCLLSEFSAIKVAWIE